MLRQRFDCMLIFAAVTQANMSLEIEKAKNAELTEKLTVIFLFWLLSDLFKKFNQHSSFTCARGRVCNSCSTPLSSSVQHSCYPSSNYRLSLYLTHLHRNRFLLSVSVISMESWFSMNRWIAYTSCLSGYTSRVLQSFWKIGMNASLQYYFGLVQEIIMM